MRIAICDDQQFFVDEIKNKIKTHLDKINITYKLDTYTDGLTLLGQHKYVERYDIIFLDVEMPGLSGEDVAKMIKDDKIKSFIIFTTSYPKFAKNGYKYNIFRFIEKCDIDNELPIALNDAIAYIMKPKNDVAFIVEGHNVRIPDIIYFESQNKTINFHLANGKTINIKSSLSDFIDPKKFADFIKLKRLNNIKYINFDYIEYIDGDILNLNNGETIKIPRTQKDEIRSEISKIGVNRHDIY